jgi:hydroxymethylbilane synthase
VRLGTRGSALALVQARAVRDALGGAPAAEIVEITTSGDRGVAGDKARWIDTIEDALERGDIDLAVHSAKDVPAASLLRDGMALAAVLGREDARDALVGAESLDHLPEGARVGTASLRRRAQLLAVRPDLVVTPLRGNVDTRLRKLREGQCDALILAAAGLRRLGRAEEIGALLDPSVFVPAPGRGARSRRRSSTRAPTPPCAPSASSSRRWRPPATRRSASIMMALPCTRSSGCPTARPGCATA